MITGEKKCDAYNNANTATICYQNTFDPPLIFCTKIWWKINEVENRYWNGKFINNHDISKKMYST